MAEWTQAEIEAIRPHFKNKAYRMSHLYHILDKSGRAVIYQHNPNQKKIFANRWYNLLILKSRRIGSTTGWAIDTFDYVYWVENQHVGVISELNSSAAKVVEKMKFAHKMLPKELREKNPITTDNKYELGFANGSSVYSETSFRGDTIQRLLISEFGPICAERPDKAKRITAGALSTVDQGQEVIVESTAKGPGGAFHQWVMEAKERQLRGLAPTKMDFWLVFIPWWQDTDCVLDPAGVEIPPRFVDYFRKLEAEIRIALSPDQKAYYVKKATLLGPDVFSEYPSTIEEAFYEDTEGRYYRFEFQRLYNEKRICKVEHERGIPVTVSFDIGVNHTVLWFSQTCGVEEHVIDHYEATGEQTNFEKLYAVCMEKSSLLGYQYDFFIWPHDIRVRQQFSKDATRFDAVVRVFGADRCVICPGAKEGVSLADGINTTRQYLNRCYIDAEHCDAGIKGTRNYTMEWSEHLQRYLEGSPRKDENADHADSLRYMAIFKTIQRGKGIRRGVNNSPIQVYQDIPVDVGRIWDAHT